MERVFKGLVLIGALAASLLWRSQAATSKFLPKSFQAKFTQEYTSSLKGKIKTSKGIIDYQHPGHIRFATEEPQKIVFVSNPLKSWYYVAPFIEGEPGELTLDSSGKRNPYIKFFDILNYGLKTNKYYKVSRTKKGLLTLSFTKGGQMETQVKRAQIFFEGQENFQGVKKLVVTFADNKTFSLKFDSIRTQVNFKKSDFTFKIPKNTRVSN